MRKVTLYLGQQWHEDLAGRVSDSGVLEIGSGPSTIYPAHVDGDRLVYGAPWVYGPAQSTLGLFDDRKREVINGSNRYERPTGSWDEQGIVYLGPVERMERIGRCDPPSGVGAACLLLILAPRAPHADALKAAAAFGQTMKGLDVLDDPADHVRKAARAATVAGGAVVGAVIGREIEQAKEHGGQTPPTIETPVVRAAQPKVQSRQTRIMWPPRPAPTPPAYTEPTEHLRRRSR